MNTQTRVSPEPAHTDENWSTTSAMCCVLRWRGALTAVVTRAVSVGSAACDSPWLSDVSFGQRRYNKFRSRLRIHADISWFPESLLFRHPRHQSQLICGMLMTTVISELDNTGCDKPPVGSLCTRVEPTGTKFSGPSFAVLPVIRHCVCSSLWGRPPLWGRGHGQVLVINPVKYSAPMVQPAQEH